MVTPSAEHREFSRIIERPLFLHFLNRELAESVGVTDTPASAEAVIKTLLLGTNAWLYTGLSILWESPAVQGSLLDFIGSLIAQDSLDVLSNVKSQPEFLTSREGRYEFDRTRYPMYFVKRQKRSRAVLSPTHVKPTSATKVIDARLRSWADNGNPALQAVVGRPLTTQITRELLSLLSERGERAITGALIEPRMSQLDSPMRLGPIVRRELAMEFTADYLNSVGGDIPTGVRGLSSFDSLTKSFPVFDVPLLRLVLQALGLAPYLRTGGHGKFWGRIQEWRNSGAHNRFCIQLYCALQAIAKLHRVADEPLLRSRVVIANAIRTAAASTRLPRPQVVTPEHAWVDMAALIEALGRVPGFSKQYERLRGSETMAGWDLLLVTATAIETAAVLEQLGTSGDAFHGRARSYIDLGLIGGARVALVQSEAGSVSPGASHSTAYQAMTELRPKAVVLLGIAFGVDSRKQTIGQILVSKQLELYEPARVGYSATSSAPVILPRGDRATASPALLSRFRAHAAQSNVRATFGLLLSGEKLIDNPAAVAELRQMYPEAIGGEMEGAGVYSAARERGVEWIVVKAICDWADGMKTVRKKSRQTLAASSAARFVLSCVQSGGFGAAADAW